MWPRVLTVALLAAAVWFGIGVWQRTRAGLDFEAAARAELPLTLEGLTRAMRLLG